MIKFLKYELKRTKSFFVTTSLLSIVFAIIIKILLLTRVDLKRNFENMTLFFFLITLLVILIVDIVYFASRYKRDIFSKTSYITFTINISTGKIILAKVLAALITSLLTAFIFGISFFVFDSIKEPSEFLVGSFLSYGPLCLISIFIYWVMAFLFLILGINLSKVKIFNNYYEFVSIILSLMAFTIVIWLLRTAYTALPYMLNVKNFSLIKVLGISGVDVLMVYFGANGPMGINIVMLLISILTIVLVYFANIYVLEEKIDL